MLINSDTMAECTKCPASADEFIVRIKNMQGRHLVCHIYKTIFILAYTPWLTDILQLFLLPSVPGQHLYTVIFTASHLHPPFLIDKNCVRCNEAACLCSEPPPSIDMFP